MLNLLQIINAVRGRIGLRQVSAVISSTDPQLIQMAALANEEGQDLAGRREWSALIYEGSFTTLPETDQGIIDGGIVPAMQGFSYILNDTIFDRTSRLPIWGPLAPRTWQARKALPSTGPLSQFRIRGGHLLFDPIPTAGHACFFEYKTRNWLTDVTGSIKRSAWAVDTDIPILDDHLMILGIKWRWKQSKGLDYAEDMQTYENNVADVMSRDGNRKVLRLDGGGSGVFDPVIIAPSGNWPL